MVSVGDLVGKLGSTNPLDRYGALEILSACIQDRRIKISEITDSAPIIAALRDESIEIRRFACIILGDLKENQAVPLLIDALDSEEDGAGSAAAQALGRIGDCRAVPALARAFKRRRGLVRDTAQMALIEIGATAVPIFIEFLKHENRQTLAVESLVELALVADIDLSEVAASLKRYWEEARKNRGYDEKSQRRVIATYREIADAVSEAGEAKMQPDGVLLVGERPRPPRKPDGGMFRQRRLPYG